MKPLPEYRWSVYAIIAHDLPPLAYFKVGISSDIFKRCIAVSTGCPLPLREILFVRVASARIARQLEMEMHYALRDYHSSGEWFRFDLTKKDHSAAFKTASDAVMRATLGENWGWQRVNLAELRRRIKEVPRRRAEAKQAARRREFQFRYGEALERN